MQYFTVITRSASHKRETEEDAIWLAHSIARTSDWVEVVKYWLDDEGELQSEVILAL